MSELEPRPRALVAIVFYKCFAVGLLTCTAIGLLWTSQQHDFLLAVTKDYVNTGKWEIIKFGLERVLSISASKIELGAIVALVYAAVNAIEAIGLWHQKTWATILVVGIVGITIPVEIYEIVQKISLVKFGVFTINMAMFVYLLKHALEERKKRVENRG